MCGNPVNAAAYAFIDFAHHAYTLTNVDRTTNKRFNIYW